MPKSAYIHIPFCKSKCKYCSFVSDTYLYYAEDYINSLKTEIENNYKGEYLDTLYFGGGTPSVLAIKGFEKIISNFNIDDKTEVTFELNPDDAEINYLKALKDLGINRLSMGAQTFNDDILKLIGRRHNSEQISTAVIAAKEAGFNNISLDLIYGLPNQTFDILKNDLARITDLGINHISTYGLQIEEDSYFYKNPPLNIPDDDTQADMYILINEYLESKGFMRYEISNFAKPRYESKHNLNYWNNSEYYGFGVAAHGYENGIRYSNTTKTEDYISNPLKKLSSKILSEKEKLEEEIFLGFRKADGINIEKIKNLYNIDFDKKYKKIIDKYYPKYIETTHSGYKLTTDGVLLSNIILSEFID